MSEVRDDARVAVSILGDLAEFQRDPEEKADIITMQAIIWLMIYDKLNTIQEQLEWFKENR